MNETQATLDQPKWSDLYASCFHRLGEAEINTWWWELTKGPKAVRNFSPELLCEAIRNLSRHKDRDGKTIVAKLPDIRDEMFAILRGRRRDEEAAIPIAECCDCQGTGFFGGLALLYAVERGPDGKQIITGACVHPEHCRTEQCPQRADVTVCYEVAVPCTCPKGERALHAGKFENRGAIQRLRELIKTAKGAG